MQILLAGKVVMELGAECTAKICPAGFVREPQIPWGPLLAAPVGAGVEARAKDGFGHVSTATMEIKESHENAVQATGESAGSALRAAATEDAAAASGCEERYEGAKNTILVGSCGPDKITKVPASVKVIEGRGGDDVIIAGQNTKVIEGGEGDDVIRGGDGNDTLKGQGGNDHIYGGNGDDLLRGESGADVLDGGPGADTENGGDDDDTLRGGQGPDHLNGGKGDDTASYADALSPGFAEGESNETLDKKGTPAQFKKAVDAAQDNHLSPFPPTDELGVYIDLNTHIVYGGDPSQGGGEDTINGDEYIVGSPFDDWIEGTAKKIDPGPGEDILFDTGSAVPNTDKGEDGDWTDGTRIDPSYVPLDPTVPKIGSYEAGVGKATETNVYAIGGTHGDAVTAERTGAASLRVSAGGKSEGVKLGEGLGALVLYGGREKDSIKSRGENANFPGAIELDGGPDADTLEGGSMEELLIDGIGKNAGTELLQGKGGEDDLAQGEGADKVEGGAGDDLFLNSRVCEGDALYAEADSDGHRRPSKAEDNAQFHLLPNLAVYAEMQGGHLGAHGENLEAQYNLGCNGEPMETLEGFNAFEGTEFADLVKGNKNHNYILGRGGENKLYGRGGNDSLVTYNENPELVIDCGPGEDQATIDGWDSKYASRLKKTCEKRPPGKGFVYNDGRGKGFLNQKRKERLEGKAGSSKAAASAPAAEPSEGGHEATAATALTADLSAEEPGESAVPTAEFHLDETAGTSASNAFDEEAPATYMAKGVGPSVNGPGPVLGGEGVLLDREELEEGEEEGASISLDGSTAYVDLNGQAGPVDGAEGYSVSLYVKFAAAPGKREYLFSSAEAGGRGAFLYRAPNGSIVFTTGQLFGAPTVASEPVAAGGWHQVVASMQGQTMSVNVDGFPYELGYGSNVTPAGEASPVSLLGAGPGVTDLLDGSIDEFTSYAGVVSEGEIFPMLTASRAQMAEYLPAGAPEGDEDGDGVPDGLDNCPATSNPDQADSNMDGIGDACQAADQDEDGIVDASDNCPTAYNPGQADANGNGIGDACSNLAPEAETSGSAAVKATTATIEGAVYPEGQTTTYYFEYGLTTSYGTKIPVTPKSVGAGFAAVKVSQALSGLAQGTTYHYRLVVQSATGSQTGEDVSFTTLKLPKATTSAATSVGQATATLNGTVNPEGLATTYQFEYGTSLKYGSNAPATAPSVGSGTSPVAVSTPLSGLVAGTNYYYRIAATSAGGTAYSGSSTFTTAGGVISGAQLAAMPVAEPFDGSSTSLSNFVSKWAALGWAGGSAPKGTDTTTGWGPSDAFSTVDGAYYNSSLTDTGSGLAAVATLGTSPGITERYFSLWLEMSNPAATTRSGYELRFTDIGTNLYKVTLSRWSAGAQTVLATEASYTFPVGSSLALTDQGSIVTAWSNTGSGFVKLIGATNSEFSGGRAGVEGSGNITRLKNFKFGVPNG